MPAPRHIVRTLSEQSSFERLVREEVPVADRKDLLLEKDVDVARILELAQPEAE